MSTRAYLLMIHRNAELKLLAKLREEAKIRSDLA